jgi:tetratricopeptide (TPR) repeat protein
VASAAKIPEVERELDLRRGRILLEELRDPDRAEAAYRRALELDQQNPAALAALDRIYRQIGDMPKLVEVLWRRGEAEYESSAKRDFFAEVGRLREERLSDDPGAIVAWKLVLELAEGDAEAHQRLIGLYERAKAWEELVELLELASRFASDHDMEIARRRRVAQVLTDEIGALDRAVDAWITVTDLVPDDDTALVALTDVHRRRGDWLAVQETLSRRLVLAPDVAARVAIHRELARLAEGERKSPEEAIGYLFQILDEDPRNLDAFQDLERLLGQLERWHDLAELLARRAEVQAGAEQVATLARAADVWEGKLQNPTEAAEILEQILAREPAYVPALTRLARIYEGAGDWDRCGETLRRALDLKPTGTDAADLYYRLGRVTEAQSGELAQALPYFEKALSYAPAHAEAIASLERAARERGDWRQVAELLATREAAETDAGRKLALAVELADIHRQKLGRPLEAVPYLERAVALAPDDAAVAETLADLYFLAGRSQDAEPLYRRLADKAKAARKPKDLARYQQRLGALREAAGDLPEALKSYEEAFRVDPSHAPTMAGLGRIYFATSDWEKARRVYRSMLLQNLDPTLGVTKADVYLQLGLIHAHLNEPPKAKSMYERGLELDPQHARLREALAQLK